MAAGASTRFVDGETPGSDLNAAHLNTLDQGGNVYQDPAGGCNVDVTAINGLINGVVINYAGVGATALTPSSTNYLYISSAGALVINTTGFPSYPTTKYFPLATVVCGASTITSITDSRWKFYT